MNLVYSLEIGSLVFSKAILCSKYLFMFECLFHLFLFFFTFSMNIRAGERGKEYQMNSDQEQGFGNEEIYLSQFFCCVTKSGLLKSFHALFPVCGTGMITPTFWVVRMKLNTTMWMQGSVQQLPQVQSWASILNSSYCCCCC